MLKNNNNNNNYYLNNSTSIQIENKSNYIRNSIILRKHILKNRFDNSSIPNQLSGILIDIDYHKTIESINNFKPTKLARINTLISICYTLNIILTFFLLVYLDNPIRIFLFPLILIFIFLTKVAHNIKYVSIVNQIETFFVGINETYEKYYNITFTPIFQRTHHHYVMLDVLTPGNFIIDQTELQIEYPVSIYSSSAIPPNLNNHLDGASSNLNSVIVGNTSLQNSTIISDFAHQHHEIEQQQQLLYNNINNTNNNNNNNNNNK